jgi:hypothetical protein
MNRKKSLVLGACVWTVLVGRATLAYAQTPEVPAQNPVLIAPLAHMMAMPPAPLRVIPSHLAIGNRVFDASASGLRAYIESIRATEPQLYAQLAPDVERLESRQQQAWAVLIAGLIVGVSSTVYAFAGRSTCQLPSVYDPNFAAKIAAWDSCTDHNLDLTAKFAFIGLGALVAGSAGAAVVAPGRSDLLDVLAKNNRSSPEPLRLQLGYDPSHRLALVGAALPF